MVDKRAKVLLSPEIFQKNLPDFKVFLLANRKEKLDAIPGKRRKSATVEICKYTCINLKCKKILRQSGGL